MSKVRPRDPEIQVGVPLSKTRGSQPHQPWMDLGLGWRPKREAALDQREVWGGREGMRPGKMVPQLLEDGELRSPGTISRG